jgi:hypothetical protein
VGDKLKIIFAISLPFSVLIIFFAFFLPGKQKMQPSYSDTRKESESATPLHAPPLIVTSKIYTPKPKRLKGYKPFSITSAKLGKEISSKHIETKLLCRSIFETFAETKALIKKYDVLRSGGDHSMAMTDFLGLQDGKEVTITLMTTRSDNILKYIMVDGQTVLSCR